MPLFHAHRDSCFGTDHSYVMWDALSKSELDKVKDLSKAYSNMWSLYLAAFDEDENFVGWSWGFQENSTTFYMCNSAVLPEHRHKGIYSKLLDETIRVTKDKGFQTIYSRHCATNNAILIPKLKHGFIISKMELDDKFGVLIHLSYIVNETRKKIFDYRCGQIQPDAEVKKIFKI